MPTPDFGESQRQLRRSRLQDALALPRSGVDVNLHRDRLIERLANYSDNPVAEFDSLTVGTVDTVVSLALAVINEEATDALVVVLLCIRVLAADGQFARLRLLASRLESLGHQFDIERPYLAATAASFALALKGDEQSSIDQLNALLGSSENRRMVDSGRAEGSHGDILLATAFQNLILTVDSEFSMRAVEVYVKIQDGLMLVFLEALMSWSNAVNRARPFEVLTQADPVFLEDSLHRYLQNFRIPALYPAQIKAIKAGATLDENHVISLPTSSGKTLIAEFRIAATLTRNQGSRAIYVAPYRLLARQVERNLRAGLRTMNLSIRDLGRGFDPSIETEGALPDVAVCTPERLDALLRLSSENTVQGHLASRFFEDASLLVLDELQLIGRPGRGPRFEFIYGRVLSKYQNMKVLGLAASSDRVDDVSSWLSAGNAISGASRPTGTLEIVWEVDGTMRQRVLPRPTEVAQLSRVIPKRDAAELARRLMTRNAPVLIVETTRTYAESLAAEVSKLTPAEGDQWRQSLGATQLMELNQAIEEVRQLLGDGHPLARYMENGIAFHHAGVPQQILNSLEILAEKRLVQVVCSTTTMAEGADLPFRAVIIPHLNFYGPTKKLERELYLNIVGRAGRANVSMEGLVFILNSDAATLRRHVTSTLWSSNTDGQVRGVMPTLGARRGTVDDLNAFRDMQSQVLGWLGDGSSYVEAQAETMASMTLSWCQADVLRRAALSRTLSIAIDDLEEQGFAISGSPSQLTQRGMRARLTGLSVPSVTRLERVVERGRQGWLNELNGVNQLSESIARLIATSVLEGVEVLENSLWLRRAGSSESARFETMVKFANGSIDPYDSDAYKADIEILTQWIMGAQYEELARIAPEYEHHGSLFGGSDHAKRTSDATEYISQITYAAGWVWSGIGVLASQYEISFPKFIRGAIESGLPSESATRLIGQAGVTRSTALSVSRLAGPRWTDVIELLQGDLIDALVDIPMTALDLERIQRLHDRANAGLFAAGTPELLEG